MKEKKKLSMYEVINNHKIQYFDEINNYMSMIFQEAAGFV